MGWSRQEVLDVARSTGETVVEAWSDHNAGQMGTVVGPMLHHTGSAWSFPRLTAPTLKTVREGRSDLQNSLCMYYIDYAGVIYCISEKLSWHAGAGSWSGVTDGNGHYAGIEAESDGSQWTPATLRSYKKLAAAILRKAGRDISYAPRHAEYALPKGRKTDFSGYDAKLFIKDVAGLLAGSATSEGFLMALSDADQSELLKRVRDISVLLDAAVNPDDKGFNSRGEITKRLRDVHGLVAGLAAQDPKVTIDAAAIAAAIPDDLARQVADELAARLAT